MPGSAEKRRPRPLAASSPAAPSPRRSRRPASTRKSPTRVKSSNRSRARPVSSLSRMGRRAAMSSVLAVLALVALPACGNAQRKGPAEPTRPHPGLALKRIGSFEQPTYVAGAPGYPDLLFVVEQPGTVQVLRNGRHLPHPFLDIRDLVRDEGERGLLSIAFPPDYGRSGRLYVYYTGENGDIHVDEFRRRSPTRAASASRRAVITIPHSEYPNHNGGQLQFLGDLLYLGTGDGGSGGDPPNNAQSKEVLLGKLLRIDPRPGDGHPYSVPADNPFVGRPGRDE